jgi:peptidoglycan hydrolase-like protein with peptidoglycan-binding domain
MARVARGDDELGGGRSAGRLPLILMGLLLRMVWRRPRDAFAIGVAGSAGIAILVNALFMQSGPHPAPIFANRLSPADMAAVAPSAPALAAQPNDAGAKADATRTRSNTVADIQRELKRHGFYNGLADGVYGPKTDTAIRDFEQQAGLRPSAEPNDMLLASIARSTVKAQPVAIQRNDPIAALLAPSPRIVAVQRALTDFGYGPVHTSGLYDTETRAAIERFEKARRRPATGQITDQLVRDLAALTGRPLE